MIVKDVLAKISWLKGLKMAKKSELLLFVKGLVGQSVGKPRGYRGEWSP